MNLSNYRTLTDNEIADCVKLIRKSRNWSQEQLADICRINLRTIQRVENGEPSSIDTRRSLAGAFEANDIDAFNKPTYIPSEDEIKKAQDHIENDYITVCATHLVSGRVLLELAENCHLYFFDSSFDMDNDAEENFSLITEYFKEYNGCHDLYNYKQKSDAQNEIQSYINTLKKLDVSLVYTKQTSNIKNPFNFHNGNMSMTAVYIIAFPIGKEPETLIIPRETAIRW